MTNFSKFKGQRDFTIFVRFWAIEDVLNRRGHKFDDVTVRVTWHHDFGRECGQIDTIQMASRPKRLACKFYKSHLSLSNFSESKDQDRFLNCHASFFSIPSWFWTLLATTGGPREIKLFCDDLEVALDVTLKRTHFYWYLEKFLPVQPPSRYHQTWSWNKLISTGT